MRPQSTPLQPFLFPMKWCAGCQTQQPLCCFGSHRAYNDGLRYTCKVCEKAARTSRHRNPRPASVGLGTKWCPRCSRVLSLRQFFKVATRPDGFSGLCKACATLSRAPSRAAWRERNRLYLQAYNRTLYAKDPEKSHQRTRRYEQKNREKMRAIWSMHGARRRMWLRERKVGLVDYAAIWTRDEGRCHICGVPVVRGEEQYDHIWPLARGGMHSADNIAVAHKHCNLSKGAKILVRQE